MAALRSGKWSVLVLVETINVCAFMLGNTLHHKTVSRSGMMALLRPVGARSSSRYALYLKRNGRQRSAADRLPKYTCGFLPAAIGKGEDLDTGQFASERNITAVMPSVLRLSIAHRTALAEYSLVRNSFEQGLILLSRS